MATVAFSGEVAAGPTRRRRPGAGATRPSYGGTARPARKGGLEAMAWCGPPATRDKRKGRERGKEKKRERERKKEIENGEVHL